MRALGALTRIWFVFLEVLGDLPMAIKVSIGILEALTDPSFSTSEPSETLDELSVVPRDLPEALYNLTEAPNYLLKAPNHLSDD